MRLIVLRQCFLSFSSHGKMENRFTKLKGVLVNNLLKEYHKQTKQQGDQAVYNHAVTEVEKILAHNTRLTEQQLQELQRNFASGVMIKIPDRNIHVQQQTTKKLTYNPKSTKNLAMSRAMTGDQNPNAFDSTEPKVSQAMQTELRETTGYTVANSGEETTPSRSEGAESKRQRRVDEWSILVLHNDVQHLEEQKKTKERQAIEKQKIREELLQQVQVKEDLKKKQKEEVTKIARQQQEEYSKWKAEQERVAQIKQAKILKEKEYEAKELDRVQKVKQVQAEKDFKEQKVTLFMIVFSCVHLCYLCGLVPDLHGMVPDFLLYSLALGTDKKYAKKDIACRRCWRNFQDKLPKKNQPKK